MAEATKHKRTYVGPHAAVRVVLTVDERTAFVKQGESLVGLSAAQAASLDTQEGLWSDPAAAKKKEGDN